MKARTWGFVLREGGLSLRRNSTMSLASAGTAAVTLLILFLFVLAALNLSHMTQVLEAQVQVVAYLKPTFQRSDVPGLLAQVRRIPGVRSVTFVTREQALDRLRAQFGDQAALLDSVQDMNPLRDELDVHVPDPGRVDAVARQLKALGVVENVSYPAETLHRLDALAGWLRNAGIVLAALLGAATVFLIANTIRVTVHARRHEIAIMKLVGATDALIRWPFVVEGAVLGLVGSLAALGVAWAGYSWIYQRVTQSLPFLPLLPARAILRATALEIVVAGLLIGMLGSGLSLHRYLRV
ncbi:MAG: ABC transporter permease [Clostridia bacterium]|nr:ABC transporter permease [Clostridia bacterium]MCL6521621.1 permease-like cell division protein FtsX [Bacillota bacterium]